MSGPVLIKAWGTDYPDSAAVSYLTGGLAALALAWEALGWRLGWLLLAGGLLTTAVWSHGASVPLVAVMVLVYVGVRLRRERGHLGHDLAAVLEMFYFSSVLWSSLNIMLAMIVAEVTRPMMGLGAAERSQDSALERGAATSVQLARRTAGAVPALLVLGVALACEAADRVGLHVPAMTMGSVGSHRRRDHRRRRGDRETNDRADQARRPSTWGAWLAPGRLVSAGAIVVMTGAALTLTVASDTPHRYLPTPSTTQHQHTPVRRGVLSHGWYHLHVWLVDLRRYLRRTPS